MTVSRCCETETTSAPVCFATRSAVRCRVPVSSDGIVGSGISWTFAQASRLIAVVDDDRAVHLRELVEELRPERRVEPDAAGVEERELVRVADHDQRALVRADDVVDRLRGAAVPGAIFAIAASSSGFAARIVLGRECA